MSAPYPYSIHLSLWNISSYNNNNYTVFAIIIELYLMPKVLHLGALVILGTLIPGGGGSARHSQ